jgi:hypothetical protein
VDTEQLALALHHIAAHLLWASQDWQQVLRVLASGVIGTIASGDAEQV